jgi:hypothetical protein
MMVMIPFFSRCSVFAYTDDGGLKLSMHYGLTGLHALKRAILNSQEFKRVIKMYSIDRYFIGKGFVPQIMTVSDIDTTIETDVRPEVYTLFLDGYKNITPHSTFKPEY